MRSSTRSKTLPVDDRLPSSAPHFVYDNFVFERNVQILERDHEQVRVVERSKSFGPGFKRAGVGDASEIRLHIEHGSNQE